MSHARFGLYSTPSGIAANLMTNRSVPVNVLGTDLDIKDCLHHDITLNPAEQIKHPGIYILCPVSLTEVVDAPALEAIKGHLTETLAAIKANAVTGKVSLLIPVNSENNHWRLARIYINNQQITSALLWDPLGGESKALRTQTAFQNFQLACHQTANQEKPLRISMHIEGIQHNAYSCMDYVLQHIYRLIGRDNEIARANDALQLRLAVVKQIASRYPSLQRFVDKLNINENGMIIPANFVVIDDEASVQPQDNLQVIFDSIPEAQSVYNEMIAKELQNDLCANANEMVSSNAIAAAYDIAHQQFLQWVTEQQQAYKSATCKL